MNPRLLAIFLAVLAVPGALFASGCGKSQDRRIVTVPVASSDADDEAGFAAFATKNTTRIGGADALEDAAASARAAFPGGSPAQRPPAAVLVNESAWQAGVAASVLASKPVHGAVLLSEDDKLPDVSQRTLEELKPRGVKELAGAQVIRVGSVAEPKGFKTADVTARGSDPYALAQSIDTLLQTATGGPSKSVIVASGEVAEYSLPVAGLAAKTGAPVLFTQRKALPNPTINALRAHDKPSIYLVGPPQVISDKVEKQLGEYGNVTRIDRPSEPKCGRKVPDPACTAVGLARFLDEDTGFGWGFVQPGQSFSFINPERQLDAAAAAPLSAGGKYAAQLLVNRSGSLPDAVSSYLEDIRPGYSGDNPASAVFGHAWLIGDLDAITARTQAQIDALLEVRESRVRKPKAAASSSQTGTDKTNSGAAGTTTDQGTTAGSTTSGSQQQAPNDGTSQGAPIQSTP